ncbi:hypothetical protein H5410_037163 [Solanum commersonii]|uniref:Uncharacterized protein n=1 Tax=Solanum commersonii TaxID=4109 RepID=A0A9J5Y5I3_SOLCO|nr:hypothetical protein H5410_037163 [Solanum commersonii]
MHFTRCHEAVNLEFELATLRTIVGTREEVDVTPYPMVKRIEEKYHALHLARIDEVVQLEFEIATLEANAETKKGMVVGIEDILCLCNQSKPITKKNLE